jgi:hypothetical protein
MTDIAPERRLIQQEETRPQAAVTESVMSRVGGGINFINLKHFYLKEFCANGEYNIVNMPELGVDGFFTYPFNFEIADLVVMLGQGLGTAGVTEIDLKWRPESGGTWQSIFSVTPQWTPSAPAFGSVRLGVTRPGFTTPMLDKSTFDPYDLIRLDILQVQGGPVESFFLSVFCRPINP